MRKVLQLFKLVALSFVLWPMSLAFADGFVGIGESPYQVKQGDFDGDGDIDFYVWEKPRILIIFNDPPIPIARPQDVVPFVLVQGANKTFTIRTNLSGLNLSAAQPSAAVIRAIDVNNDGNSDAVLTNLGPAVPSANPQIVFASTAMGPRNIPTSLKAMNAAFRQFVTEVHGWFEDKNYFENTAWDNGWYELIEGDPMPGWWAAWYLQAWGFTWNGVLLVQPNEDPFNPATPPASCSWGLFACRYSNGQWELAVEAWSIEIDFDYSNFNANARALTQALSTARANDDLVAGSLDAAEVSDILETMFGSPVFQDVLYDPDARLEDELNWPDDWLGDRRLAAIQRTIEYLHLSFTVQSPPQETWIKMTGISGREVTVKKVDALIQGDLNQVNAIVLHGTTSDNLQGSLDWAVRIKEGTHFYIDLDGQIYQTVSLDKKTAHVGKINSKCIDQPSTCTAQERQAANAAKANGVDALFNHEAAKSYPDRYPINSDSIGIEIVRKHTEEIGWATPTQAQLDSLDALVDALKTRYGLEASDIYGHDKIKKKTPGESDGLGYP